MYPQVGRGRVALWRDDYRYNGPPKTREIDGSIAGAHTPDESAKLLLSVLLGVRVLARVRPQRDVLEGAVNGVLALLKASAWLTGWSADRSNLRAPPSALRSGFPRKRRNRSKRKPGCICSSSSMILD